MNSQAEEMIAVVCHIEFCSLNPIQVLTDETGKKPRLFSSILDADEFLSQYGFEEGIEEELFGYVCCTEQDNFDDIIDKYWKEQEKC